MLEPGWPEHKVRSHLARIRESADAGGGHIIVKAILETALRTVPDIVDVSVVALQEGVDILKTSTGKRGGATDDAVRAIAGELRRFRDSVQRPAGAASTSVSASGAGERDLKRARVVSAGASGDAGVVAGAGAGAGAGSGAGAGAATQRVRGIKVSGGVRTPAEARHFLSIALTWCPSLVLTPQQCRIGASALLDGLVAEKAAKAGGVDAVPAAPAASGASVAHAPY